MPEVLQRLSVSIVMAAMIPFALVGMFIVCVMIVIRTAITKEPTDPEYWE